MNKQELKQQLSELSTAVNSLANALTVLHTNVSIDVPNVDTHHCGQDAVNEEKLSDEESERLVNGYKNYCRATLEDFLDRKITWWIFKRKMLWPDLVEWAAACCQDDACCQAREKRPVDNVSAVVNDIPDSIKSLEGMQIIKVCGPKCKDCPCGDGLREYPSGRDMSSCVKIELVGGYMLCLSPLPNSIVAE